jgi:hypothetical protein
MRLAVFIQALLMLSGAIDPTRGWLIVFVALAGVAAFRMRPWRGFSLRPALDVRMGTFILAVLLLAGAIEPTRDWLIAVTAVSGIALVMPGLISLDGGGDASRRWRHRRARWSRWDGEPFA